ncbi:MAG TPA: hypothetical protein VLH40_01905 [Atribacteraceae bacterium]|nr:hypothetical protein [Atribacteraceae bacterium]
MKGCSFFGKLIVFILSIAITIGLTGRVNAQHAALDVPVIYGGDLPLNQTVTGEMGPDHTVEFSRLVIPESGFLTLTLKGPIRTQGQLILYDINGMTEIGKVRVEGRDPGMISAGLFPGDYYVKLERTGEQWSYELEAAFDPDPPTGTEPNDRWFDASLLNLGQTNPGHLGYWRNGWTDTEDWWTVSIEEEGLLTVNVMPVREEARGEKTPIEGSFSGRLGFTARGYLAGEHWYRVRTDRDGVLTVFLSVENDHERNPLGQNHTWTFTAGIEEVRIPETISPEPAVTPTTTPPSPPPVPTIPPSPPSEIPAPPSPPPVPVLPTPSPAPEPPVSPWEEWPGISDLPSDRGWAVTFAEGLDEATVNPATIFVAQEEDGQFPIPGVTLGFDPGRPHQVMIEPPDTGWIPGETYYLFIAGQVRSLTGAMITRGVRMPFTIERAPEPYEILSIFNDLLSFPVPQGPPEVSEFTLDTPHVITRLETFHFPSPALVGSIALMEEDGTEYDPWTATGKPGPGDFPDVYWVVNPDLLLPPGTYRVVVSHPGTWSFNEASGNRGFVTVEGYAAP